jgi:hypothetical protein
LAASDCSWLLRKSWCFALMKLRTEDSSPPMSARYAIK